MFATSATGEGFAIFMIIVFLICVGVFKIWVIVARPDVYKAQLEDERHRREQRNSILGPMLGGGFKLLGMFLSRRR